MSNPNPSPANQFKPGQKAPAASGRPKATRDRLSRAFFAELGADFDQHGKATIVALRMADPGTYIRVIASLQPKEFVVESPLQALSDDKLAAAIEMLAATLPARTPPLNEPDEQHTVN